MKLCLLLALSGCYLDARPGMTAPVVHGHGNAAFEVGVGFGGEYETDKLDIGAGITSGVHAADATGYVPFGLEGRLAIDLARTTRQADRDILFVAHAGVAAAVGMPKQMPADGNSPGGAVTSLFAGLALGSTRSHDEFTLRQVAFGLSATRFWPEDAGAFWSLGGALELSWGFRVD